MTMVAGKEVYRNDRVTTASEFELQSQLQAIRHKSSHPESRSLMVRCGYAA